MTIQGYESIRDFADNSLTTGITRMLPMAGKRGEEMAEYKLELKGVSKSFPGVKALDNFRWPQTGNTALMGENGAGKS